MMMGKEESKNIGDRMQQDRKTDQEVSENDSLTKNQDRERQAVPHEQEVNGDSEHEHAVLRRGSMRSVGNGSNGDTTSDGDHRHEGDTTTATPTTPCLSPKEILDLTRRSRASTAGDLMTKLSTNQQSKKEGLLLAVVDDDDDGENVTSRNDDCAPPTSSGLAHQHDRAQGCKKNRNEHIGTILVQDEAKLPLDTSSLPTCEEDYKGITARSICETVGGDVDDKSPKSTSSRQTPPSMSRRLVSTQSGAYPIRGRSAPTGDEEYDNLLEEGAGVSESMPGESERLQRTPDALVESPVPITGLRGSLSNDTPSFTIITEAVNVEPEEEEKRRLQERVREMEEQQRNTVEAIAVDAVGETVTQQHSCCKSNGSNDRRIQYSLAVALVLVAALVISLSLVATRPRNSINDLPISPSSSPEPENYGEQDRLPPALQLITDRGYIRCGVVDVEFSLDLVSAFCSPDPISTSDTANCSSQYL